MIFRNTSFILFICAMILLFFIPSIHGRGQINMYMQMLFFTFAILGLYIAILIRHYKTRMTLVTLNLFPIVIGVVMHIFNFGIGK